MKILYFIFCLVYYEFLSKMQQCVVCLRFFDEAGVTCDVCSFTSCEACVRSNDKKCCGCLRILDETEREVHRQTSLIAYTRKGLELEIPPGPSSHALRYKQCPGCSIWIEKVQEDCPQIFCTVCKTVWSWNTLAIVKNIDDIHNPLYFEPTVEFKAPAYLHLKVQHAINKCMRSLLTEAARYATDSFLNRVMFIAEQISFEEFKRRAAHRYLTYEKHMKLRGVLEAPIIDERAVSAVDRSYSIDRESLHLPYV